jgi:hypothetical protein
MVWVLEVGVWEWWLLELCSTLLLLLLGLFGFVFFGLGVAEAEDFEEDEPHYQGGGLRVVI